MLQNLRITVPVAAPSDWHAQGFAANRHSWASDDQVNVMPAETNAVRASLAGMLRLKDMTDDEVLITYLYLPPDHEALDDLWKEIARRGTYLIDRLKDALEGKTHPLAAADVDSVAVER